jgi:hypothetical protein
MEVASETKVVQDFNCPAALIGEAFSPTMWATLGLLDSLVAELGTA